MMSFQGTFPPRTENSNDQGTTTGTANATDNDYNLIVTNNLIDAARAIRQDSFTIYKVPSQTSQSIRMAWIEARNQFVTLTEEDATLPASCCPTTPTPTPTQQPSRTSRNGSRLAQYHCIHQGQLHGFHEPSAAKYLFRAFCNSSHQPWPPSSLGRGGGTGRSSNDRDMNDNFRLASIQVSQELHQILTECLAQIQQQEEYDYQKQQQQQHHHQTQDGPCRHRWQLESSSYSSSPQRKRPRQSMPPPRFQIPPSALDPMAQCPLDYFLYHGKQQQHKTAGKQHGSCATDPTIIVPNCTAHVDRGLLIAICLTNVPGLEVRIRQGSSSSSSSSTNGGAYHCPELVSHHDTLYQEAEPCAGGHYICILAGDQLDEYCYSTITTTPTTMTTRRKDSPEHEQQQQQQQRRRRLNACVHRVRNNLPQARLSISYELRGLPICHNHFDDDNDDCAL